MKKVFMAVLMTATMAAQAASIYQKVTSTPTDWTGTYLIVCESESVVFNGNAPEELIDSTGGPAIISGITFSGTTLTGSQKVDTATFTIGATDDENWPWYIKSRSGLYLGHKDEKDNGLSTKSKLEDRCKLALSIDKDGNFVAKAQFPTDPIYVLRYNSDADNLRFRFYKPTKKEAIQIYKLISGPSALPELTNSSVNSVSKVIRNGQLLIIKDGKEYSVLGK